ncbi:SMC family ATPase, partial [Streptomyces sp. DSM 44917]
MRLHRLTVTAFGPFRGTEHVDFAALSAAGLFLLHGPTGAGKTSLLDAVCFALYGSVPGARQSPAVSLRSDHADPRTPTEVVLDLTLAGRRLEITRRPEQERPKVRGTGTTRDRARTWLREQDPATGRWRPLSHSHQEAAEELGGLLGMSRDQFCQVVLLPQGDFARFLRAGAEDRAKLLGRLFDTRRFAAAEAHLAERRAGAEREVRAGDEALLAVAHRVRQAAGPWHPPDGPAGEGAGGPGPGEPGLADAVLAAAAQARSAAREHRDTAAAALAAAEAAHTAAQRDHAGAAERARLQQRHHDAARRAAAVEAERPAREAARARLERARAAEAVAPALRLHAAARAEHAAALEAESHSRAALPGEPADAPAGHLAARERAARERLGALTAARRAAAVE